MNKELERIVIKFLTHIASQRLVRPFINESNPTQLAIDAQNILNRIETGSPAEIGVS